MILLHMNFNFIKTLVDDEIITKMIENFGIGTDIESIDRFRRIDYVKNNSFLNKIFTKNELDYCFSKEISKNSSKFSLDCIFKFPFSQFQS